VKRYTTDIDNCRSCPNCYWDSGVYMCDSLDIALNAGNTEPKGFDMDTNKMSIVA